MRLSALPWPCWMCERSFTHARFLARHVTNYHYEDDPTYVDQPGEYRGERTESVAQRN